VTPGSHSAVPLPPPVELLLRFARACIPEEAAAAGKTNPPMKPEIELPAGSMPWEMLELCLHAAGRWSRTEWVYCLRRSADWAGLLVRAGLFPERLGEVYL
jgi:hypothetical protein